MSSAMDILNLRILLAFYNSSQGECSVTEISRALMEKVQKISRAIIGMEKEGLIDRTNIRAPFLTEKGLKEAERYSERIRIAQNHLLYEGVDLESAKHDSYMWALYCSDELMEVIRKSDTCYRVKHELRNQKTFNGDVICKRMDDGCYEFPFIIYREQARAGDNISMGNEGFAHPCTLYVNDGVGMVQLLLQTMSHKSGKDGKMMIGKLDQLKYFQDGRFVTAEIMNNVVFFPAEAIKFVNMGSGTGNILHGSVSLKMRCSCGIIHMPESDAIFTILI